MAPRKNQLLLRFYSLILIVYGCFFANLFLIQWCNADGQGITGEALEKEADEESSGITTAEGKGIERKKEAVSPNFYKSRKFLPGEEVVSPTGQKLKIWSTEGPVSVSKSPEPFEDSSEKQVPRGTGVIVDDRQSEDHNSSDGFSFGRAR